MARCYKQVFANEAAFRRIERMVDDWRVGFGDASGFQPIDFQGIVGVGSSLLSFFQLARLVEKPYI